MGGTGVARTMTWSLDKKRSYSTMHSTYLTMGMRPPSLLVLAAHSKPLHLCSIMLRMMSLMAAIHLWELYTKIKGHNWGRAIQSAILCNATTICDVAVGGGGRVGGHRTMIATNYKRCEWDRSLDVRMLVECDPSRLGHPLHVKKFEQARGVRAEN